MDFLLVIVQWITAAIDALREPCALSQVTIPAEGVKMGFGFLIPALFSGIGSALSAIGGKKRSESEYPAQLQDKYRYDVLNQQQFDPMAPYRRLQKGSLYSAFARAWGLDKILPEGMLDHIASPGNYPGTSAIGGGENLKGPPGDIPGGERKGGLLSALGGVLGGAGTALGGLYPSGGGSIPANFNVHSNELLNKPPWG